MPPLGSTPTSSNPATPVEQRRLIPLVLKLIAFCFVGGVGFAVDLMATMTLINFGLDPRPARALGIAVALFSTYVLNRGITFRREAGVGAKAMAGESARYVLVALTTSAFNWAVYTTILALAPGVGPVMAIVIGSVTAMVASYLGFAKLVFRG